MNKEKYLLSNILTCLFMTCYTIKLGPIENTRKNLIQHLLTNYEATIIPGSPVHVTFTYWINQIDSIDQKEGNMVTNGYLSQMWFDSRLDWQSLSNFSNIKNVTIPSEKLWRPDTAVVNVADQDTFISSNVNPNNYATVFINGLVILNLHLNKLKTRCHITTKKFPFDKQQCSIQFSSWGHSKSFIDYSQSYPTVKYANLTQNSIWELEDIEVNIIEYPSGYDTYQFINYSFFFYRKSLYYILNGFFSCFILNIMTMVTFYLPYSDQINLSITCFLTLTVNALIVQNDIPVQSDYIPYITYYLLISMTFPLLSIIWFITFEFIKDNQKLPKLISYFLHKFLQKISIKYKLMTEDNSEAIEIRFKLLNFIVSSLFCIILLIFQLVIWIEVSN